MTGRASRAGFVLAGGKSSRMGENKAFLRYRGRPLIEHIAEPLWAPRAVAPSLASRRFTGCWASRWSRTVFPDRGPLAGIETALATTQMDWNLIAACDMPALDGAVLRALCDAAAHAENCLIPQSPAAGCSRSALCTTGDVSPRLVPHWRGATARCSTGVAGLHPQYWAAPENSYFQNVNTALEWSGFLESRSA